MKPKTLYKFSSNSNLEGWENVDDVVMGGISNSFIELDSDGKGVFSGVVSLENNGGFSSVRYQFEKLKVTDFSKILITMKGDGKAYQFRVKHSLDDDHSYTYPFLTTGEWQTLEIKLNNLYPIFRGRKLNLPNFDKKHIEEIRFLIANQKNEEFKLILDEISFE